jgi:hypothetical protein
MSDEIQENIGEDPSLDLLTALVAFTGEEWIHTHEIPIEGERGRLLQVGSNLFLKMHAAKKDSPWFDVLLEVYSTIDQIGRRVCSPHTNNVRYWGVKYRVFPDSDGTYGDMLSLGQEYIKAVLYQFMPAYRFLRLSERITLGHNTSVLQ